MLGALPEVALRDLQDEDLAARADRDLNAFAELYDRYLCRIYRFVRSQTRDDPTAEDLTAQTFFKALAGARSFRGQGSYRSWIFRIARNTIATWRARHSKGPIVLAQVPEAADPGPSPSAAAVADEEQRIVRLLVNTLPPAQREVLWLRYLDELTTDEVARVTGRTQGAVRTLLHRAIASLRRALNDRGLGAG